MSLLFDPEKHRYFLNGNRLPGVTSVLNGAAEYAGVPRDVLEEAAERGTFVHKACEMHIWGTLDIDGIPDHLQGYVRAFDRWLADVKPEIELTEERVWHRTYRYAGTLDLMTKIKKRTRSIRNVTDIKTAFRLLRMVGPQLAAYQQAHNSASDTRIEARYGLQLMKDGKYKYHAYESATDFSVFLSCLNVNNFFLKDREHEQSTAD